VILRLLRETFHGCYYEVYENGMHRRSDKEIKDTGPPRVLQALWDARTQHRDETAYEISLIAYAVYDSDWSNDL
jgi:hypothetical protein